MTTTCTKCHKESTLLTEGLCPYCFGQFEKLTNSELDAWYRSFKELLPQLEKRLARIEQK